MKTLTWLIGVCLAGSMGLAACSSPSDETGSVESKLGYDTQTSRLVVILNRDLGDQETLHARVRSLAQGDRLDCESMARDMPEQTAQPGEHIYSGPSVEQTMFENPTTSDTLLAESDRAHRQRLQQTYFVEVCVTGAEGIVHQARYDIRQALDRTGESGKFDTYDDGERIASTQAYASACVSEMGDIPFWGDRLGGGGASDGRDPVAVANEATFEELTVDVGLRSDRAEAIIDYRAGDDGVAGTDDDRRFESLEELDELYGIGPATIDDIRTYASGQRPVEVANEATFEELTVDVGLRSARAQTIIDYRAGDDEVAGTDDDRRFASLDDVDDLPGIHSVTIRALAEYAADQHDSQQAPADWNTVDCTEIGTPVPTEVDGVPQDHWVSTCDNPQTIYSHCEADARTGANGPRVAHARNAQGTHWVLLCRKSHRGTVGRYNDVAMIGNNPFTGQTCFFQNQLPTGQSNRPSNDGMHIPHPADNVDSEASPQMWSGFWGGIEGGIGPNGGIQCQGCHSTDAFIHSPWIDGAVDEDDHPIVPKMGQNPDYVEGYNGPYKLIDAQDQGWNEPVHLVSEEASACTSCHRVGLDQWTSPPGASARSNPDGGCVFCGQAPWLDRLEQADDQWDELLTESHRAFEFAYWMPPNASDVLNEQLWPDSEFKQAMDFIRHCAEHPDDRDCDWQPLPEEPGDPTELPDIDETGAELAADALDILGAPYQVDGVRHEATQRCAECHATSRVGFRNWKRFTDAALDRGLDYRDDVDAMSSDQALQLVDSMRRGDSESFFSAHKIGIMAPGTQFPYFSELFKKAYGADWGLKYGAFRQRVSMPKGSHSPMSAREFAVVAKWFVDEDLAHLDELLPEAPRPASCEEVESQYGLDRDIPWLSDHIDDMQYDGWAARNRENDINMFGCPDDDPLHCFEDGYADRPEWSADLVDDARIVQIDSLGFHTSFWMRSSADGRFVGDGGGRSDGFGATITDLVTGEHIGVDGSYDPGFFPNNDGFIMQGAGAGLCGQSVLTRQEAIADGIDFSEAGCTHAEGINLYQHVAVDTDGGDYLVINSQFTSDAGGGSDDPRASFAEGSTMKFSPLVFDGTHWTQKEAVVVDSPYQGDSVLSPSGDMVLSRFAGPDGESLGYMLRRVEATANGQGSYDINIDQPLQFLCTSGGKANISYDERFMVTYHYEQDTANIYLADLVTAETYQITDMPADARALFPHFRSDGWIYFQVSGDQGDRVVASDAAIRLAQP